MPRPIECYFPCDDRALGVSEMAPLQLEQDLLALNAPAIAGESAIGAAAFVPVPRYTSAGLYVSRDRAILLFGWQMNRKKKRIGASDYY